MYVGKPSMLYDPNNTDWVPQLKMGYQDVFNNGKGGGWTPKRMAYIWRRQVSVARQAMK